VDWVAAIPVLPALAFAVLGVLPGKVRNRLLWLAIAATAASWVLSVIAFFRVLPGGSEDLVWSLTWTMGTLGGHPLTLALGLDPVAAVMLFVVTTVAVGVEVYSLGYMHRDPRVGWHFALLCLFTTAMLVVVLSNNLLLFFAGWELMGVCSFLLIGFWYELEGPRRASFKAFMVTRLGDLGFILALAMIWSQTQTFEMRVVLESAGEWGPGVATAIAVSLLWAAMGKSAQVPLHVWLPDAMAGPTPASALIHAATMVAAGVFLVARTMPIFDEAPAVLSAALFIGGVSTLLAGILAAAQHDVKKVMAYSTISQLGLMFMALGAAAGEAAIFHLVTHAFFKALLFLSAGVIIHAASTQDMREMGGLRRYLPWTTATFAVGALSLAGVAPFSGFFSKDDILLVLWEGGHRIGFVVVLISGAITAFYVARLWFRVFVGPEQDEHLHEGHASMVGPMVVLASLAAIAGFFGPALAAFTGGHGAWPVPWIAATSQLVVATGFGVAYYVYGRRTAVVNTRALKERYALIYATITRGFYFDNLYNLIVYSALPKGAALLGWVDSRIVDGAVNGAARAYAAIARGAWSFDGSVVDGAVGGLAALTRKAGTRVRSIQTGRVQTYQRLALAAVVLALLVLVLKEA